DDIKDKLDITDYIRRRVQLQKAGRNFKGLCPFHTEKTPSFFVFPDNHRWHCFGCGKGGDIFTFAMEIEGIDFHTALEDLANQAGVILRPLSPAQQEQASEADRLRALIQDAASYYHTLLLTAPQADHARTYLHNRSVTAEGIEIFQLGYSMNSWDALRTHLFGKGYSIDELVKSGMLVQREDQRTYDRFRDRVMIPICDRRGKPIAFGGRVLSADAQPKYMNSPQTVLFDKGQILFGYHLASQAIREQDAAIIVEGYMDVIVPYQAGYRNVVAPMGTALTEAHLKQLQRLTQRFILAMDADSAGIHGTIQGLETARNTLDREQDPVFDARGLIGYEGRLKADIRVATIPDGLDPDELVIKDPEAWENVISSSQPIVRYYFQQLMQQGDPSEPKTKARIVDAMLPLLSDISDSVEREAYIQEFAQQLALNARSLADRLHAKERAQAVQKRSTIQDISRSRDSSDPQAHILTLIIRNPQIIFSVNERLTQAAMEAISAKDFDGVYQLIWVTWMEIQSQPQLAFDDLLPQDVVQLIQTWQEVTLPDIPHSQLEHHVTLTLLSLRKERIQNLIDQTRSLRIEAQEAGDLKGTSYAETIMHLSIELNRVQQALAKRSVKV
ncbi:MAG: DNA primase, partial [Anaerolineae bacterium]|nr:DNA primase [Anaerolineae bacterium]